MSRLLKLQGIIWVFAAVMLLAIPTQKLQAQPNVNVTFQTFYNDLQPYGNWINYQNYGYCWVPNVTRGFRPYYTNGYWAMTNYGNTWVSNYSWGWAPFHYGNWTYDDYYGWIWVPGTTWGPAWVTWRNGGGNYGWAPIAPGVNISVAIGPRYSCANSWWTFVPQRHIYNRGFQNYCRSPRYNGSYIRQTTIINNTYYAGNNRRYVTGPSRVQVQRATGQQVRTYGVRGGRKPGKTTVSGNSVNIYRPTVSRGSNERPMRVAQNTNGRNAPSRNTQATQSRSAGQQRAATMQRGQQRGAGSGSNAGQQRAVTQRSNNTQQRAATMQRGQRVATPRSNPGQQRAANHGNNSRQRAATVQRGQQAPAARTQQVNRNIAQRQQQSQITQRRQQAWQNKSQPAQRSGNMQRSNTPARSRTQAPTQRNMQRSRPQSYSRPQQSRASKPQMGSRSRAVQSRPSPSRSSNAQKPRMGSSRGGSRR